MSLARPRVTFARAGDWPRAAVEFERLARTLPHQPTRAFEAGVARGVLGDYPAARAWMARVVTAPEASDSTRQAAQTVLLQLAAGPPPRSTRTGR